MTKPHIFCWSKHECLLRACSHALMVEKKQKGLFHKSYEHRLTDERNTLIADGAKKSTINSMEDYIRKVHSGRIKTTTAEYTRKLEEFLAKILVECETNRYSYGKKHGFTGISFLEVDDELFRKQAIEIQAFDFSKGE